MDTIIVSNSIPSYVSSPSLPLRPNTSICQFHTTCFTSSKHKKLPLLRPQNQSKELLVRRFSISCGVGGGVTEIHETQFSDAVLKLIGRSRRIRRQMVRSLPPYLSCNRMGCSEMNPRGLMGENELPYFANVPSMEMMPPPQQPLVSHIEVLNRPLHGLLMEAFSFPHLK